MSEMTEGLILCQKCGNSVYPFSPVLDKVFNYLLNFFLFVYLFLHLKLFIIRE